jgi:NAD(P)-dependent dehydrogenase (short-subunit alcohol dehydrogenase family)
MSGVAVVTGGASGLGEMIAAELESQEYEVHIWDLPGVDVGDAKSVRTAAHNFEQCDLLVNCAGINRLRPFDLLNDDFLTHHMQVNAFAHVYTTQALLPWLRLSGGTVCNIISNASHKPMTYSLAYNVSKAAAAMITRQMAHEIKERGITIFGVSPNRLAYTPMSASVDMQVAELRGWSVEETFRKQREAMPIGEETNPRVLAEFIGLLLSDKRRHKYLHGSILEYGA